MQPVISNPYRDRSARESPPAESESYLTRSNVDQEDYKPPESVDYTRDITTGIRSMTFEQKMEKFLPSHIDENENDFESSELDSTMSSMSSINGTDGAVNPINRLQELVVAEKLPNPVYSVHVGNDGVFEVICQANGEERIGYGNKESIAKRKAAHAMLILLTPNESVIHDYGQIPSTVIAVNFIKKYSRKPQMTLPNNDARSVFNLLRQQLPEFISSITGLGKNDFQVVGASHAPEFSFRGHVKFNFSNLTTQKRQTGESTCSATAADKKSAQQMAHAKILNDVVRQMSKESEKYDIRIP